MSTSTYFEQNYSSWKWSIKKQGSSLSWLIQSLTLNSWLRRCKRKGEYIAIKYHYTPSNNDSGSYEINLPYYGGGTPEEWLAWKVRNGRSITTGPLRYTFTDHFVPGDAKATFNQAVLGIGICTVDNFNKVLLEMTKHGFPAYAFREQKRYLRSVIGRCKS